MKLHSQAVVLYNCDSCGKRAVSCSLRHHNHYCSQCVSWRPEPDRRSSSPARAAEAVLTLYTDAFVGVMSGFLRHKAEECKVSIILRPEPRISLGWGFTCPPESLPGWLWLRWHEWRSRRRDQRSRSGLLH
jgi:hypothetical protein